MHVETVTPGDCCLVVKNSRTLLILTFSFSFSFFVPNISKLKFILQCEGKSMLELMTNWTILGGNKNNGVI